MLYNAALVLEGGAFRGQYTAGVLDCLLKHHIEFKSVIGVSAGALCGACYVAKQYEYVNHVNTSYRHDSDYVSLKRGLHHEDILNLDFLFDDHGWDWHQFDHHAYERSASNFTAVATSIETGKRIDFVNYRREGLVTALKASSSMPFLVEPQLTDQGPCLDGGIADSIPTDLAKEQGFDKIVVVRTREATYRKKSSSPLVKALYRRQYKDYPVFAEEGINRPEVYNQRCNEIDAAFANQELYCITPQKPVKVSRFENNVKKLAGFHDEGLLEMEQQLPQLIAYLER